MPSIYSSNCFKHARNNLLFTLVNYPSTSLRVDQWVFSENFDKNQIPLTCVHIAFFVQCKRMKLKIAKRDTL